MRDVTRILTRVIQAPPEYQVEWGGIAYLNEPAPTSQERGGV